MSERSWRRITVSLWQLCLLVALLGLGWLTVFYFLGERNDGDLPALISRIGFELLKTLISGATLGVAVTLLLRDLLSDSLTKQLERSGITEAWPNRTNAAARLLHLVRDKGVRTLDIVGISLRDFLSDGGSLREVWHAVVDRLKAEEEQDVPKDRRLRVRLLLLHPYSSEGRFRYSVEKNTIGNPGVLQDVRTGIEEILCQQKFLYGNRDAEREPFFLEARLYEHCPFSFVVSTNLGTFVEQYYYRDHRRSRSLPLLYYSQHTDQHSEVVGSLRTIWNHARSLRFSPEDVGTAAGVEGAGIVNVFRRSERDRLGRRQSLLMEKVGPQETISILTVAGRYHLSDDIMSPALARQAQSCTVRIALVNPVCQQAILRAVAESGPVEELGTILGSWGWEEHRKSSVYVGVHNSIREVKRLQREGYKIALRLHASAISSSLVLIGNGSAFVESYYYGRPSGIHSRNSLGGDHPVFEFARECECALEQPDGAEREVLLSEFEIIWQAFSVSLSEYKEDNDEDQFTANLKCLLASMPPKLPGAA
jgi:hypothetical protein